MHKNETPSVGTKHWEIFSKGKRHCFKHFTSNPHNQIIAYEVIEGKGKSYLLCNYYVVKHLVICYYSLILCAPLPLKVLYLLAHLTLSLWHDKNCCYCYRSYFANIEAEPDGLKNLMRVTWAVDLRCKSRSFWLQRLGSMLHHASCIQLVNLITSTNISWIGFIYSLNI